MKTAHTPGPWESYAVEERARHKMGFSHGVSSRHPAETARALALLDGNERPDEITAANARLIAAAPDLLEALIDLLCLTSPGGLHGTEPEAWGTQTKQVCATARAAIHKARGAQP